MHYFFTLIMGIFFVGSPLVIAKIRQKTGLKRYLSQLVCCFLLGICIGNLSEALCAEPLQAVGFKVANICTILPVLIAIPILLMSSNILPSLQLAPRLLTSFLLCLLSVSIVSYLLHTFYPTIDHLEQVIGCLTAVYIGGTPNMMSIAYATQLPEPLFLSLNTTDIVWSGLYFIFLITIGPRIFGFFLTKPATKPVQHLNKKKQEKTANHATNSSPELLKNKFLLSRLVATTCTLILLLVSYALACLFPDKQGEFNQLLLMLILTSLSIAVSFHPKIKALKGLYAYAHYLLLIFAVGLGFQSNFHQLLQEGSRYFVFNGLFLVAFVVIHLILSIIFRIDRDTFILSSTACVFGPPFIGQICDHINQPEWVAAGITLGILGLICGTYLGIMMAELL